MKLLSFLLSFIISSFLHAQNFKLVDTIKTPGRIQGSYLSSNNDALYVLQSYVLTRYDLRNIESVKAIDKVLGGGNVFSDSKYITQSHDSLFFKDVELSTSEYIYFDKQLKANNMSCDRKGENIVIAGLEVKDGIYYITKKRIIKQLQFEADTSSYFIEKIIVSDDGKFLAIQTFSKDFERKDVKILNLENGKLIGEINSRLSYKIKFLRNNSQIISLSVWGDIHIFNLFPFIEETGITFIEGSSGKEDAGSIDAFDLIDNDSIVLSCGEKGFISAWDPKDGSKYYSQPLEFKYKIRNLQCSEKYTVISFKDSLIAVYNTPLLAPGKEDAITIEPVLQRDHVTRITGIIEDSIRNYLYTFTEGATSPSDNELKIWDKSTLLQVKTISNFGSMVQFDGRYITSNNRIFDTKTLMDVTPYLFRIGLFSRIRSSDFHDNSIFVEDRDTLSQLNLFTVKKMRTLVAYKPFIRSAGNPNGGILGKISISREKAIIASAFDYTDGTKILLHSLTDGSFIRTLKGYHNYIRNVIFYPIKDYIIAYDWTKLIIWDINTGDSLAVIEEKNRYDQYEDIYSCTFSKDNKSIVIGYGDGKITFWNMQTFKKENQYDLKKLVSAIHFITEKTAIIASESKLFLYDFSQPATIYEMSNKVKIKEIVNILVDEKKDMLYTLANDRTAEWDLRSLLHFYNPDRFNMLPKYLGDISFNMDSTELICTDLFKNPNVINLITNSSFSGKEPQVDSLGKLEGIRSVTLKNGTIITAAKAGWESSLGTLLIFNKDGTLKKNLWSQLRLELPYDICLVPDTHDRFLYFTATDRGNNFIFSMDMENYKIEPILSQKSHYINYMTFINDSILLIAGTDLLFLNIRTKISFGIATAPGADQAYYDPGTGILFAASASTLRFYKTVPYFYEFRTKKADNISCITYSPKNQEIITGNRFGEIIIYDLNTLNKKLTFLPLDTLGYAVFTPEGYYYANKSIAPQMLAFKKDNRAYVFNQFDQLLNRPDIILSQLYKTDSFEINAIKKAFEKRIKIQNAGLSILRLTQPVEKLELVNKANLPNVVSDPLFKFTIGTEGGSFSQKKLVVTDNDVPIIDKDIQKRFRKDGLLDVKVTLCEGVNRLFVYTLNRDNQNSFIQQIRVVYTPALAEKHNTYFIGIGINQFENRTYNLRYCVNDIRDLANEFVSKGAVIIDTLFDQNVTNTKIKSLKEKLLKTGINDRVIIAYSGHGLLNKDFDYFLSTYSINFDKPEQNGLPYEELENLLVNTTARKKLLLIDACHSGEVDKEEMLLNNRKADSLGLKKGSRGIITVSTGENHLGLNNSFELMRSLFVNVGRSTGATIISAAAGTQFALERGDLKNGVFTYSILELMKQKSSVTISELKKYVNKRVTELTKGLQVPTSRNENLVMDWKVW